MKRIYAIPGLGTTKELFRYLQVPGAEITVLNWPAPKRKHTLKSYAAEFTQQIDASQPFSLIGVSFGGMLCMELNEILNPEQVILISSCKCRTELPRSIRILKYLPLHLFIGEKALRRMNARSRRIIGFEKTFLPEFTAMMDSMAPDYYTCSINCIVNWERQTFSKSNVTHLHGTADRLIPLASVKATYVIAGGTHAMIVNKAEEISGILKNTI
ncbi:MAG: alpha/beta hydrolase [Bacteroidia bacterium]